MSPWTGARRAGLPSNWTSTVVPAVKRRDHVCVQCGQPGNEVDHIGDPRNHDLENLRLLCSKCHMRRTQAQAAEGRARARKARAEALRQAERNNHPGRIRK